LSRSLADLLHTRLTPAVLKDYEDLEGVLKAKGES
jgi:hypothetical protein